MASTKLRDTVSLVSRSLALDASILRLQHLPVSIRSGLTAQKYAAVLRLAMKRTANISVAGATVGVSDLYDLGTLLGAVVDVGVVRRHGGITTSRPVIVDVGANIGQFCIASKLYWPGAEIISFEPDPDVFTALVSNTETFDRIHLVNVGLGAEEGKLKWHRNKLSVMSSFRPRADSIDEEDDFTDGQLLPVCRLDDATADIGAVDLLKIDVEGYEYEVLAGGADLLKRTRLLMLETSLQQDHGPSNLDLFGLVRELTPNARIVDIGRVYHGSVNEPLCVDMLIDVHGDL